MERQKGSINQGDLTKLSGYSDLNSKQEKNKLQIYKNGFTADDELEAIEETTFDANTKVIVVKFDHA